MRTLPRRAVAAWRRLRLRERARRHNREDPPLIRRLVVMLQSACELRCRMCDLWLSPSRRLPRETVLEMLRSPALALRPGIAWTGGEPFLYPGFAALYAQARALHPDSWMSISTSGVPARAVREFLAAQPDLRRTRLVFSYDGAGTHDAQRGRLGAESELLHLLGEVRRAVPEAAVAVRMTITPGNADAVEATFLKSRELGVGVEYMGVSFHEHYTNGVRDHGPQPFAFSPAELVRLQMDLSSVFGRLSLRREREEIGHLAALLRRLKRGGPLAASPAEQGGPPNCPVPSQAAFVRADGALLTCRSCPPVGDVLREGLGPAWMSAAARALRVTGCPRCEPRYNEF